MKRSAKWLIAALVMILAGAALFTTVLARHGWNFSVLDTVTFETNVLTVEDGFTDIEARAITADVAFVPAQDGRCTVTFCLREGDTYSAAVQDGTLKIAAESEKHLFDLIRFTTRSPKVTVALPADAYKRLTVETKTGSVTVPADFRFTSVDLRSDTGDVTFRAPEAGRLKVSVRTGDVRLEDIDVRALVLSSTSGSMTVRRVTVTERLEANVSTGDVTLEDVRCAAIASDGATGDITLTRVLCDGEINISRSTGDVRFLESDAGSLTVSTGTGDVRGSLLSGKTFTATTGTGDVRVPATTGAPCEIRTATGDIHITVK